MAPVWMDVAWPVAYPWRDIAVDGIILPDGHILKALRAIGELDAAVPEAQPGHLDVVVLKDPALDSVDVVRRLGLAAPGLV